MHNIHILGKSLAVQANRQCEHCNSPYSFHLYIIPFNLYKVLQHGVGESQSFSEIRLAAICPDVRHTVGVGTTLRVNEGHCVLPLYAAQNQLGVVLKKVDLEKKLFHFT